MIKKLKVLLRVGAFRLKRKILGAYYWVGPSSEVGVCDECASVNPAHHSKQAKVPVRRLIEDDNYYLCKEHWEKVRSSPDSEDASDLKPFLHPVEKKS